ncbi:MAG: Verru_Chthon cassette protein D [Chthoniobacterales bacterium]
MQYPRSPLSAFSLLELLIVTAIIIILMAAAVPAVNSIALGSNLERAGQTVADTIGLARQDAVAFNREVQVAFLELPDDSGEKAWRGIQVWRVERSTSGLQTNAVTRVLKLPQGMLIAPNTTSPLLTGAPLQGTHTLSNGENTDFRAFRISANGSLDGITGSNNYVTVQSALTEEAPPANFYTIQINPVTGKVSSLRP